MIASEKIGRETVQHVSNIYSSYLVHKMLTEQQQLSVRKRRQALR